MSTPYTPEQKALRKRLLAQYTRLSKAVSTALAEREAMRAVIREIPAADEAGRRSLFIWHCPEIPLQSLQFALGAPAPDQPEALES